MKAVTWQRWISIAACALALAVSIQPVLASKPTHAPLLGLPSGLPELPTLGETMQRNISSGIALNGFDPVAYQLNGKATPGNSDYELLHLGSVWRFESEANLQAFRDAPSVYEPAFAGFDAIGVAQGRAVETDPRQFAIIGSRLFLFRTADNRSSFVKDASLMHVAETRWRDVYETIAR